MAMRTSTLLLSTLASLRLTRFITTDTLGGWTLVEPAVRWATSREGGFIFSEDGSELVDFHSHEFNVVNGNVPIQVNEDRGWRSKLVSGLECPHCVGFWIGAATLTAGALAEKSPTTQKIFKAVAGSLALSYVTGHISERLDA